MSQSPRLHGPSAKPKSGGAAKQLIIFLHGVGADGQDLISLSPFFADAFPDACFMSPNAPFECDMAPYGYQWFSLLDRSPAPMLAGVKIVEPIVNAFIDEQMAALKLTPKQVALVGFSQGTMTSLFVGPRRTQALGAIVGFSGALLAPELLPVELKSKPAVCLIHGQDDTVVPFKAMEIAQEALSDAGFECESHARPWIGHGIDPEGITAAVTFLQKHLG